ncbi:MAG: hypothetical protein IPI91_10995 [Flavobacteriales bacterium]|nr:hypothetical protein [Flavobacteriales bacterium]
MLRKICLLIVIGSLIQVHAQVNEIGITGGLMYYIGDLNPTRHYPKGTKPAVGIVFRHNINDRYAIRLQGLYGTLQASDSNSPDSLQQLRNLSFRSRLFEAAVLFEINFFKYRDKGKEGKFWTPFIFGGLAYFRADPQAQLGDTWIRLQPLGTEGQGTTVADRDIYKIDRIAIPFGAGLKANGPVRLPVGMGTTSHLDGLYRRCERKYVDNGLLEFENGPIAAIYADRSGLPQAGISNAGRARGDTNTRDWYQYTGFSITYILSRFSDCDEQYNWMRRRN